MTKVLRLKYTNWKGETAVRSIVASRRFFGKTEYHPEYQWLVDGFDIEKQATRTFAMDGFTWWGRMRIRAALRQSAG